MADAGDLKSPGRKVVWVRVPPSAPTGGESPMETILKDRGLDFFTRLTQDHRVRMVPLAQAIPATDACILHDRTPIGTVSDSSSHSGGRS